MDFFRLHAYAVEPSRTTGLIETPEGGVINVTQALSRVLNRSIANAKFDDRVRVAFRVDADTRTNDVRDLVLAYGFGDEEAASDAAAKLAVRLAGSMDQRSRIGLFIVAATIEDPSRTVYLWVFPRDEAFRFRTGTRGPSIQVLTDVFSQTSMLRKAARFSGRNRRNEFILGRVLDFQVRQKAKVAADFFISEFLMCSFGTYANSGTRILARAFRSAFDNGSPEDQAELFNTMMNLRSSPGTEWSPQGIADELLSGGARDLFLKAIADEGTRATTFRFQPEIFDKAVGYRIFQLENGIYVSVPFDQIGGAVKIAQNGNLTARGKVLGEKIRSQPA